MIILLIWNHLLWAQCKCVVNLDSKKVFTFVVANITRALKPAWFPLAHSLLPKRVLFREFTDHVVLKNLPSLETWIDRPFLLFDFFHNIFFHIRHIGYATVIFLTEITCHINCKPITHFLKTFQSPAYCTVKSVLIP